MEFPSEPRTACSSPDWTAQHRCDSTQNWCPQSRVIALWAATLPTPWRTLPSALSCRVQMLERSPPAECPGSPSGEADAYLLFLPCVDPGDLNRLPRALRWHSILQQLLQGHPSTGRCCGRPVALCLPLEELLLFRQTLAFPGSLASPFVQGRPHCLPPWLQELSVS